jgi:hypothetical protein
MIKPTKPIFYNGFKVKDGLTIKNRVERIFFTEVYLLSNNKYLYIFTNIKPEEIVDRGKKYKLITIHFNSKKYQSIFEQFKKYYCGEKG